MPDPHRVLGVPQGASEEDVRMAFRRLVRIHHPDRFATASPQERAEAERRLREVVHAYQALRGQARRHPGAPEAAAPGAAHQPPPPRPGPSPPRSGTSPGTAPTRLAPPGPGCLRPSRRLLLAILTGLALLVGGLAALASRPSPAPAPPRQVLVEVLGRAYDVDAFELAANATVVIRLVNRDVGYQHNVSIYRRLPDGNEGARIFEGRAVTGPGLVDYVLRTPAPGTYGFRCDLVPTMRGQLLLR